MKSVNVSISYCNQCPYYLYIEGVRSKMTGCFCERAMQQIMSSQSYNYQLTTDKNDNVYIPSFCPLSDV